MLPAINHFVLDPVIGAAVVLASLGLVLLLGDRRPGVRVRRRRRLRGRRSPATVRLHVDPPQTRTRARAR